MWLRVGHAVFVGSQKGSKVHVDWHVENRDWYWRVSQVFKWHVVVHWFMSYRLTAIASR